MNKAIYLLTILFAFTACKSSKTYVSKVDESYYRIDKKVVQQDTTIINLIAPYKESLGDQLAEVLSIMDDEFVKALPNGTLNNLVADAIYHETTVFSEIDLDFAIQNYGGIRIPSLPKGDISISKIYELMPFDNSLVVLKLDGDLTLKFLNRIAEYGGWPISKSLSFTIGSDKKAKDIMIHGKPFDASMTYSVAMPDYIANGGDSCDFLKEAERIETGVLIRDLLIYHFRRQVRFRADFEKRIKTSTI